MPLKILTEEQEKEIVSLYRSGASMRDLYYEHGYTTSVVNRILKKYGVPKAKVGDKTKSKQKALLKAKTIKNQPPIDCNKQGKKCIYHVNTNTTEVYRCNYCLTTGKIRGGDPHSCTKYCLDRG